MLPLIATNIASPLVFIIANRDEFCAFNVPFLHSFIDDFNRHDVAELILSRHAPSILEHTF